MIVSTLSFAVHTLVSSFRILKPVAEIIELVLPYRSIITKAIMGKINFNTKHLTKGDPLPPFNGKLRVYAMRYCPFVQRTILALLAKGVDFEVVNINLFSKPEWLTSKSPLGKVPALEIKENEVVYESLITVEYVDLTYPGRQLLPQDPLRRAQDRIIVEVWLDGLNAFFGKIVRAPDTITPEIQEKYHKTLDNLEQELQKRGTKFLHGNEPGYVDYMIWPWLERAWLVGDMKFDKQRNPRLTQYINDMLKDPAVEAFLAPKEALEAVLAGYRTNGPPDYDYLLRK